MTVEDGVEGEDGDKEVEDIVGGFEIEKWDLGDVEADDAICESGDAD